MHSKSKRIGVFMTVSMMMVLVNIFFLHVTFTMQASPSRFAQSLFIILLSELLIALINVLPVSGETYMKLEIAPVIGKIIGGLILLYSLWQLMFI
jgi:hypothetical protein